MALPTLLYGVAKVLHLYNKVGNTRVKILTLWQYLLYYMDVKLQQWENRIMPMEMKLVIRTTKYIWQDYKQIKLFYLNLLTQL